MDTDDISPGCAVITGGGTGIGAACALRLAATGRPVVLVGRRPEPLEQTADAVLRFLSEDPSA